MLIVFPAALLLGALIADRQCRAGSTRALAGRGHPSGGSLLYRRGSSDVGWYVSSFIVKPNELVREKPYIVLQHRLDAAGLTVGQGHADAGVSPPRRRSKRRIRRTIRLHFGNIRLWDWHALQDTLRQIQEIRTYYDFPDIRY